MHDAWQDQLPLYVAGQLSDHQRQALEQHLAECNDCQHIVQVWQDVALAIHDEASRRVADHIPPLLALPPAYRRHPSLIQNNGHHRFAGRIIDTWKGNTMSQIDTVLAPDRMPTTKSLGQRALNRIASVVLALMLLGAAITFLTVVASHTITPEQGSFSGQVGDSTPIPIPTATPTPAPPPDTLDLNAIQFRLQMWNGAGPATLAMALSYVGWMGDQAVIKDWLQPHPEDKGVTPWQLVHYVQDQTAYDGLFRMGGTVELLTQLLAADFPVIVQTGIQPADEEWMGHYVLLVGYDDANNRFLTFDSYLGYNQGQGRPSRYETMDAQWRHFNRAFIVIYDPSRQTEFDDVLGDYADAEHGYEVALEAARSDAERDPDDHWAWFNMGTAYVALKRYEDAAIAYDQALNLELPYRMLWYQYGPYEAYFEIGDYDNVLALANSTYSVTPYVDETFYWRGMAYMAKDDFEAAVEQFQEVMRFNPNFQRSQALVR